jgi:hypothetical protein
LAESAIHIWSHPGGEDRSSQIDKTDPTGSKPTSFYLFGTEYEVDTWREMLLNALSLLAEFHGDKFITQAVKVKTDRRAHIASQPNSMNTPMQIPGTKLWVEANQSARSVLSVIRHTMEMCGDNLGDFEAIW